MSASSGKTPGAPFVPYLWLSGMVAAMLLPLRGGRLACCYPTISVYIRCIFYTVFFLYGCYNCLKESRGLSPTYGECESSNLCESSAFIGRMTFTSTNLFLLSFNLRPLVPLTLILGREIGDSLRIIDYLIVRGSNCISIRAISSSGNSRPTSCAMLSSNSGSWSSSCSIKSSSGSSIVSSSIQLSCYMAAAVRELFVELRFILVSYFYFL